ncbi:MAG: hypothetical protein N2C14_21240, partial [Planctomycetales bacterium]
SDSYETYAAARKIADLRKLAAGWEVFAENAPWRINLGGGIKVVGEQGAMIPKPRPPADPNAQPKPPAPVDQID